MRLIKPSIELLAQAPGQQGVFDIIELCGKTSYKSPVKGGEEAEKFVSARVNEGHLAVLEFGTIYLKVPPVLNHLKYVQNPYSKVNKHEGFYYITTNYRVIVENKWEKDLQWMCEPTEYHYKRYTAKIITDRGVSHELVRHRTFSFCQESTRYCNYSKDKFDNELTFIIPSWFKVLAVEGNYKGELRDGSNRVVIGDITIQLTPEDFNEHNMCSRLLEDEWCYSNLIKQGWTPQQARQILPNALKTEICMCGFEDAWQHFFDLRYRGITGKPHPDMYQVALMLYNAFKEQGIQF